MEKALAEDAEEIHEHTDDEECSHCSHHHHHHDEDEEENPKEALRKILLSAALLVVAWLITSNIELPMAAQLAIFLVPYLIVGGETLKEGLEGIREGEPFDEDFLMSIATIGALFIGFLPGGEPMFAEAVFVMLFFQIGEMFEGIAEDNSRRSISQLMDIRPDSATVERQGKAVVVAPDEVAVGETIIVRPGEKVPMDAVIIEGTSTLDTMALTGESAPRSVRVGDELLSGCVNETGVVRATVTKPFGESTASKILRLVESAGDRKSRSESFISAFARIYTPIVVVCAVALALVPPIVSGDFAGTIATWLLRALTFLVVSCPCALVLSVPLTFFGGIGAASKQGILIKGSNYMDALSKADTVVFDKTGTLTRGIFQVAAVHPSIVDEEQLLHLAAHVERHSSHPIAAALRAAFPGEDDECTVEDVEEIAGRGVVATVNGKRVAAGNSKLMDDMGAKWSPCDEVGTIIHVAQEGTYLGHVVIRDQAKDDSKQAISDLHAAGVKRTVMLTGDREEVAASVAGELGLDEWHSELLPADKVDKVEALLADEPQDASLCFVGDGINDAPVLARADIGFAMGAMGSDAAIEAADVVLMDDKPSKVALAMRISRKTISIAWQNIIFAIAVKVVILALAALGMAPMWLAVFGDVGVMVICVLNATRALRAN